MSSQPQSSLTARIGRPDEAVVILVADDDAQLRDTIARRLTEDGHSVVQAADGLEATQRLSERRFHVALIDLQMPKVDGLALLRLMREEYPLVRRIALSEAVSLENALAAMRYGSIGILTKPLRLPEIHDMVALAIREISLWNTQLRRLRGLSTERVSR